MKAALISGVKKFEIKDIEEPKSDGYNVIVDIKKSGICGSDLHYFVNGSPISLIMGHEFCGIVKDKGARTDLKVGDRVTALPISPCGKCDACKSHNPQYCSKTWEKAIGLSLDNPGALTETIKIRPDMVCKVPNNMSDEEVCMVEPTAVSYHAIKLANIKKGQNVLVIGGGIIGLGSLMFAKYCKASYVCLTETNEKRKEKALDLKLCDEAYNPLNEDTTKILLEKTNGGFDVVIECCGNSNAVNSALSLVKPGGTVILVGVSTKPIETYTALAVTKELTIKGAIAYTVSEFKECINLISKRKINVMPFVSLEIPLNEVENAYEKLTSGTDEAIKIIVNPKNK